MRGDKILMCATKQTQLKQRGHCKKAEHGAQILTVRISVAVNYRYSRYKIDMTNSIDNRYGFLNIDYRVSSVYGKNHYFKSDFKRGIYGRLGQLLSHPLQGTHVVHQSIPLDHRF